MSTQHTPLPWKCSGVVVGTEKVCIADTIWSADPDNPQHDLPQTEEEAEANAAYIVTACNAYPALLEQRDKLRQALQNAVLNMKRRQEIDGKEWFPAVLDACNAALALSEPAA